MGGYGRCAAHVVDHLAWPSRRERANLFVPILSEAAVASSLDAIQVFGGNGYTAEFELERDLRDSVGSRIYSGTVEIQRNIIARTLGLPPSTV